MQRWISSQGCRAVTVLVLASAPWAGPYSSHAADNLNIKGVLVEEACSIRPEDEALELDFETTTRELYLNARTSGKAFQIHLEGCDTSIGDFVTTTFSGNESLVLPGLLALSAGSAAKGVVIGLETPENKPLPLNVASDQQALRNGSNLIEFKAFVRGEPEALKDQTIVAGRFSAVSTFTLSYP